MTNIAVFVSGNGSNFQSILDAAAKRKLDVNVKILVCDQPGAYAIERAKAAGIETFIFNPKLYKNKQDYEKEILSHLRKLKIHLIVLAGYMRLIGSVLLSDYQGRIMNIHPSLLPQFPGKDAVGQALAAGTRVTGVTVHFVDEGMDTGPVIAQEKVHIEAGETKESLQRKIQTVEHQLYPAILQQVHMAILKKEEEVI